MPVRGTRAPPDPTKISLGLRVPWRDTAHRRSLRETPTSSGSHSGPRLATREARHPAGTALPRLPPLASCRRPPASTNFAAGTAGLCVLGPVLLTGRRPPQGRLPDARGQSLGPRSPQSPRGNTNAPRRGGDFMRYVSSKELTFLKS